MSMNVEMNGQDYHIVCLLFTCLIVISMKWSDSTPHRQLYFYNGTKDIGNHFVSWNDSKRCASYELYRSQYQSLISTHEKEGCTDSIQDFAWMFLPEVWLPESNETLCSFDFEHMMLV